MKQAASGVRWSHEMHADLVSLSNDSGVSVSDLVRMAVGQFIEQVRADGCITLPITVNEASETKPKVGSRNIPIRFDADTIARIDRASHDLGLTRSGFIKLSVELQIKAAATANGSVSGLLNSLPSE